MPTISSITRRISFRSLIRTRYDNLHAPGGRPVGRRFPVHDSGPQAMGLLIIIKLILLFGGDEALFFPNILNERYDNDADKAAAVRTQLINHHRN